MKKLLFATLLFYGQIALCQTLETDREIKALAPDSIFWTESLTQFVETNDLQVFDEDWYTEEEVKPYKDFYIIGSHAKYAMAFINDVAYIAIKDGARYRLWSFSNLTDDFGEIRFINAITINKKNLLCFESTFHTSWSMSNPYAGSFNSVYQTLLLFDTASNEIVFSKRFTFYEERVKDDDKYERYRNNDTELDSTDYTYQWFNYCYVINKNKIEFYTVDDNPYITSIQNEDLIALYGTDKKPEFYYEYKPKQKKWVKK